MHFNFESWQDVTILFVFFSLAKSRYHSDWALELSDVISKTNTYHIMLLCWKFLFIKFQFGFNQLPQKLNQVFKVLCLLRDSTKKNNSFLLLFKSCKFFFRSFLRQFLFRYFTYIFRTLFWIFLGRETTYLFILLHIVKLLSHVVTWTFLPIWRWLASSLRSLPTSLKWRLYSCLCVNFSIWFLLFLYNHISSLAWRSTVRLSIHFCLF